ncbi:MAG: 6-phosphogluconolactonase [Chlamydiales bacterium]
MKEFQLDERRTIVFPGNAQETLRFAVEQWAKIANTAIAKHGCFTVALSGGSTPKKIFQELSNNYVDKIDWGKVFLFWSDERSVTPDSSESNYHMAMEEGGLKRLHIPDDHIFRMVAEKNIESNSAAYEKYININVKNNSFDLIMLGMGDDGHTASLFPNTDALYVKGKLVTPNHIPKKDTWRMSFTFECINNAQNIYIYVLGASKSATLSHVLLSPPQFETYPSQKVGTADHKATWIVDEEASKNLLASIK